MTLEEEIAWWREENERSPITEGDLCEVSGSFVAALLAFDKIRERVLAGTGGA